MSLTAAEDPYCTVEEGQIGIVYDLLSIIPHIKKIGKNPYSDQKLQQSDLVKLIFHKNDDGEFHCPVTYKLLNENSHIVAIKETGNVYSYEAYKELNKDAKNYRDLLTDEKFTPLTSVITLQDPQNPIKFQRKISKPEETTNIEQN